MYFLGCVGNIKPFPISSSLFFRKEKKSLSFNYTDISPLKDASTSNSSTKVLERNRGFVKRVQKRKKPISQGGQHSVSGSRSDFDLALNQMEEKNVKFENELVQVVKGPLSYGEETPIASVAESMSERIQDPFDENVAIISSSAFTNKDRSLELSCPCLERPLLPFSSRKLLVLDVNGLLADIVSPPPKESKSDINISRRAIFKRPFCYDFLEFCLERFDVGIWSSRTKKIIDKVVDYLLGDLKNKLLFSWDLSHCTGTKFRTLENRHKPLVFKDLRKIWEQNDPNQPWKKGDYNESNTLLLDDSPYKAMLNPMHTAIFPHPYNYKDGSNSSLGPGGDIRVYLEQLAAAENVQKYVEHHPFGQNAISELSPTWDFYNGVITSLSSVGSSRASVPSQNTNRDSCCHHCLNSGEASAPFQTTNNFSHCYHYVDIGELSVPSQTTNQDSHCHHYMDCEKASISSQTTKQDSPCYHYMDSEEVSVSSQTTNQDSSCHHYMDSEEASISSQTTKQDSRCYHYMDNGEAHVPSETTKQDSPCYHYMGSKEAPAPSQTTNQAFSLLSLNG